MVTSGDDEVDTMLTGAELVDTVVEALPGVIVDCETGTVWDVIACVPADISIAGAFGLHLRMEVPMSREPASAAIVALAILH